MRNLIEGPDFEACVNALGGARVVDAAMDPIIDALINNPYGFPKFENDWISFRCARTKGIEGYVPPLIVVFRIEDKNVVLEWVDEVDDGELPE